MAKKIIKFGTEARKEVQGGIRIVVKAVKSSYGPRGRFTIIEKSYGSPEITNDGVTIAKAVELEGMAQIGVSLIQEAANKTNEIAGDGTSATSILAGGIIAEGIRVVESGSDPVRVRTGIFKARDKVLDYIESVAKPINSREGMADVATISCRNPEIGKLIAEILDEVGKDGVVTVQNGETSKIEKEVVQGMQFDKGYKSPYFVTDSKKMEAVSENPYILVTDLKITSVQDILSLLENLAQMGKKELVIIAEDIENEALANFVLNKIRGVFNIFAIQAPAFGDRRKAMLQDIAILTGATYVSGDLGMTLKSVTIDDLGTAEKVISNKDTTTIIGGKGDKDKIQARINEIRQAIDEATSDYDKEKLQERLAKLAGGVGVIKVGAATEMEMKELKYTVEDALNATKAAVSEGVVPGGASTFLRAAKELDVLLSQTNDEDEKVGINIVRKALQYPFRAIANNSGIYDISILVSEIENNPQAGYDFKLLASIDDMLASGIIDPALVLKEAVRNATSVAGSFIASEVVMVEEPKKDETPAGGGMDMSGMGGMM